MDMNQAEVREPLEMIEPPADLAQRTKVQQANAPDFGLGFRKDRLDSDIYQLLLSQFQSSVPFFRGESAVLEIVNRENRKIPALYYEDPEFNKNVCHQLQPMHEAWSGMRLQKSACYGFRVYQRGTFLHNHVDVTETHIISSTICVDYRLDSPWPLYIEDQKGRGYQIDLEPGEFIFYEGSKLLHGRPYPLNGDYYAGMFVHYRPAESNSNAAATT